MSESARPAIDVMIPVAPKDLPNLDTVIGNIRENCLNPIENIHIIGGAALRSETPYGAMKGSDVHWFNDEDVRPTPEDIHAVLTSMGYDNDNVTWYFQQVLKLGLFNYLNPDAQHVLQVDADFTFIKPTEFVDTAGRSKLAYGYPFTWHPGRTLHTIPESHAAISAASRLVPGWRPVDAFSGMQHHMVFDRAVISQLVNTVQEAHGKPFWNALIHNIETSNPAGVSEFVLYRHFAHLYTPDRVTSRHINTADVIQPKQTASYTLDQVVEAPKPSHVDAVGCHKFRNFEGAIRTMDYIPDTVRPELLDNLKPLLLNLHNGVIQISKLDPETTPGDTLDLRSH
jgi:hypothetical protein